MKNTLVSIGYTGSKRVYLNIPKVGAIRRYLKSENQHELDGEEVDIIEFDDEFGAYLVYEKD